MSGSIVVVGAGLAGLGAVRALRDQGYEGPLVLLGAERHAPYDRPPLSKGFLARTVPEAALALAAPQDADLDVEVRQGESAVALHAADRTVELGSGERVGGAGVVIATGARARLLPGTTVGDAVPIGVHTLRTLDDAVALRADLVPGARLVVVGGGFIGAEVASTARALGVDVTVVDADPLPLAAALGPEVARFCAAQHADHGVRVRAGVPVDTLVVHRHAGDGRVPRVSAVRLGDGTELPADAVLVGIGSVPDVGWLAGSGLAVAGGIRTDAAGSTGLPGVVATGDCTRRWEPLAAAVIRQEHWTNALHHPQRAVAALLAGPAPALPPLARLPYLWSDQHDSRLQFAGHYRPGDVLEVIEGSAGDRSFAGVYRRDGREVAVVAVNDPRAFTRRRRALAATLVDDPNDSHDLDDPGLAGDPEPADAVGDGPGRIRPA